MGLGVGLIVGLAVGLVAGAAVRSINSGGRSVLASCSTLRSSGDKAGSEKETDGVMDG